jgi:hypothetical protein
VAAMLVIKNGIINSLNGTLVHQGWTRCGKILFHEEKLKEAT